MILGKEADQKARGMRNGTEGGVARNSRSMLKNSPLFEYTLGETTPLISDLVPRRLECKKPRRGSIWRNFCTELGEGELRDDGMRPSRL